MYYSEELYHHGILGQKWGKRNGPPYPLSVSSHSSSEKKAGWIKSIKEKRLQRSNKAIEKDIRSFDSIRKTGYVKNGKTILSKDQVDQMVKGLQSVKDKNNAKLRDIKKEHIEKGSKLVVDYFLSKGNTKRDN